MRVRVEIRCRVRVNDGRGDCPFTVASDDIGEAADYHRLHVEKRHPGQDASFSMKRPTP